MCGWVCSIALVLHVQKLEHGTLWVQLLSPALSEAVWSFLNAC